MATTTAASPGATAAAHRSRWPRRILLGLLIALGVLLAAGVITLLWVRSGSGRRYVARRIERGVSGQMLGRLQIGALTAITRRGVSARDVRFIAPGGEQVIVLESVDLDVRWRELLRGQLVSPSARATGGRVVLHDDVHGTLSIERTFEGRPDPSESPSDSSEGGGNIHLQRIAVSGLTLVGAIHGVPDFRVSAIRCGVSLRQYPPRGELLLVISDLRGNGHLDTPVAIELRFTGGTFRLDTGARERTRANLTAMLSDNRVRLTHTTTMHGEEPHIAVQLAMPSSAGVLDGLPTIVQASWAGATSSNFEFTVTRD
ncbi:MAG: hypothetical protein Q8S73_27065 [Deltaproteobacteria bacterium]|nr:hypothetical protein [Myxococcales bacterium]MDP3217798.1 hypothetical protein [Deltaproteobacteria bacterium]